MSEDPESEAVEEQNEAPASEASEVINGNSLRDKIAEYADWESLVFNDRLYSVDESDNRDGNYLVDVLLAHDETIQGPRFDVEATAEGLINGLRWTLKLKAGIAAKTLETLHQTFIEEVEAGHEEDAGMVNKTTSIQAVRGTSTEGDKSEDEPQLEVEQGDAEAVEKGDEEQEEETQTGDSKIVSPITAYKITKTTKHGEEETTEEKSLIEADIANFISEGANIILLRLLIKSNILINSSTSLQMQTIDPNLNVTSTIYKKLDDTKESIGGSDVEVTGIERVIICREEVEVTTNSYFLPSSHLAVRQQKDSPTIVKIESLPVVTQPSIPEEEEEEEPPPPVQKPAFEKKELNWEEDMMLFSKYLDRKEELKASHLTYIRHHPELKCLLADFLQQLLLRKPDQVLPFAESFFSTFSLN